MLKGKKAAVAGLIAGILSFTATPVFARSISLKDAGIALWIFIIIGAVIVLLQLIPALILFFSFIGTSSSIIFRRKKSAGEEISVPGFEPAPAKK